MAEAEDVITDAALHATKFVQGLWRRHRAATPTVPNPALADVAQRLDLLILAVFGRTWPLRVAQVPARTTLLARTFQWRNSPRVHGAIPATDGTRIWLPAETGLTDAALALERFRTVALQQAMRVARGSAVGADSDATPLVRDLYLLIEAHAADADLTQLLPGLCAPLQALRAAALSARPALSHFAAGRQPFEAWVRRLMTGPVLAPGTDALYSPSPVRSRQLARDIAGEFQGDASTTGRPGTQPLFKDWWTGELLAPAAAPGPAVGSDEGSDKASDLATEDRIRSARLARRPKVREAPAVVSVAPVPGFMCQACA